MADGMKTYEELEEDIAKYKQEKKTLKKEKKELEQAYTTASTKIEEISAELIKKDERILEIEKEKAEIQEKLKSADNSKELEKAQADYKALESEYNKIDKERETLAGEKSELKEQLDETKKLKREVEDLNILTEKKLSETETKLAKVESDLANYKSITRKLNANNVELQKENTGLKEQSAKDKETIAKAEENEKKALGQAVAAFAAKAASDKALAEKESVDPKTLNMYKNAAREHSDERKIITRVAKQRQVKLEEAAAKSEIQAIQIDKLTADAREERLKAIKAETKATALEKANDELKVRASTAEAQAREINEARAEDIYGHVANFIYTEFGVQENSTDKGRELNKAVVASKNVDTKTESDYQSALKLATKKGASKPTLVYTNDGYEKKVDNIVDKYKSYVGALPANKVEEFEGKYVDTKTVTDKEAVVRAVINTIAEREVAPTIKSNKWLKYAAAAVAGVFVIGATTALGFGIDNKNKGEQINEDSVKKQILELDGEVDVYTSQINSDYIKIQDEDTKADKIYAFTNPTGSAYKFVGGARYVSTQAENAHGYDKVKLAVSESENIIANVDTAKANYDEAIADKDLASAQTYKEELASYKDAMSTQATNASQGVSEMLGIAGMTWEEVQAVISMMQSPVLFVDFSADEIAKNNSLLTFGEKGKALKVMSCQYQKSNDEVSILVECVNSDRSKYLNYITFKTQESYDVIDQYKVIEELQSARTSAIAYDKDLETNIEGTTISTSINGVEVNGVATLKYSLLRNVDKKADATKFKANAIVVILDEEGNFVGSKAVEVQKSYKGTKTSAEVEAELQQLLVDEINIALGLDAELSHGAELE